MSKVVVECDEVAVLLANFLLRFSNFEINQSIRQAKEVIHFDASIEGFFTFSSSEIKSSKAFVEIFSPTKV